MRKYCYTRFMENLDEVIFHGVGKYNIPQLEPEQFYEAEFINFSKAKQAKQHDRIVHFFEDDYRFERIWRNWKKYGELLSKFDGVVTPDFSMFTDYPIAIQIYNHYRKHFVGAYLQCLGIKVYPCINWSTKESFDFCFDGEPKDSTVVISSVGTQKSKESKRLFLDGYYEMINRLNPSTIVFYGKVPNECKENIIQIRPFYDKFQEVKTDGWKRK